MSARALAGRPGRILARLSLACLLLFALAVLGAGVYAAVMWEHLDDGHPPGWIFVAIPIVLGAYVFSAPGVLLGAIAAMGGPGAPHWRLALLAAILNALAVAGAWSIKPPPTPW